MVHLCTLKDISNKIIILYYDKEANKLYPDLFALINNKLENGYKELFISIYNILNIGNTIELNLKSVTTDFEIVLINGIKYVFPEIKMIECFYHFERAIK